MTLTRYVIAYFALGVCMAAFSSYMDGRTGHAADAKWTVIFLLLWPFAFAYLLLCLACERFGEWFNAIGQRHLANAEERAAERRASREIDRVIREHQL